MTPDSVLEDIAYVKKFGLWGFVRAAWEHIEAVPLVETWHLEEICKHLEAVSRGECKRLIINVPPGCSKSSIVSVLWPAWDWLEHNERKWIFGTFDDSLAMRDAIRCRGLIRSSWYQERWGAEVCIDDRKDAQETQHVFSTTRGGRRVSATVGANITGWHSDIQVVDDPIKPQDIAGDPEKARSALEKTWIWWKMAMASRRADPKSFCRVIIMQRLHELDLVGRILDEDKIAKDWTHLMLPMRFEAERACKADRRKEEGELLCPDRFDEKSVKEIERDMGVQVAAAQLQQRPAPSSGNVFNRDWFHERWKEIPRSAVYMLSADCSFKDKANSDFVAIHVWASWGGKYYLVDRIHEKMGLPDTVRCIKGLCKKYPKMRGKLIEDKANGPAVEQVLRHEMSGIIMVTPEGGKISRANAVTPLCQAGNVILPENSEWGEEVLNELCSFPVGRHDDDVDAFTQAIIYLHDNMQSRYLSAMQKVKDLNWKVYSGS